MMRFCWLVRDPLMIGNLMPVTRGIGGTGMQAFGGDVHARIWASYIGQGRVVSQVVVSRHGARCQGRH